MARKSKTSGNTDRQMIYRFNDSAHYLFYISFPQTILSSHTELPFPKHQAINKQKTQHPSNTNTEQAAPHQHIVEAALLSTVKAI